MSQTISPGLSVASAACDTPSRAAAPGARFCTTTSACSTISRLRIACPSLCLTSSVRLSFDRLVQTKCDARPMTRSSYARAKSPTPGRSILITRAPRSASWRVQKGAAIACSRVTTVTPSRGRIGVRLERSRQAEDVLGDVRKNHVGRDRRDLVEARLAELAFDVVLAREAEAAMRLDAHVGRLPRRFRGKVLRHVRLRAAWLARVEKRACPEAHQVGGLDLDVGVRDRELNALVFADRPVEHDALVRILDCALDEPSPVADAFGGDQRSLGVEAVEDV